MLATDSTFQEGEAFPPLISPAQNVFVKENLSAENA